MGAEIIVILVVVALVAVFVWKSFHSIGAAEVGLVAKRFAFRKLGEDNPIAFHGEAGYQARLLMPGLRFKFWPMFGVKKFPWVQVPAGEIGVVIAQVGAPLPIGAKSAVYTAGVRQLLEPRTASSSRAARRACSGRCSRRARSLPIHPVGVPRAHAADGLRPAGVARPRPAVRRRARSRPSRSGSRPTSCASS